MSVHVRRRDFCFVKRPKPSPVGLFQSLKLGQGLRKSEAETATKSDIANNNRRTPADNSSFDSGLSNSSPLQNGSGASTTRTDEAIEHPIRPKLKRSSSIMSKFSGKNGRHRRSLSNLGKGELGRVKLRLRYSFQVNHLMVTVGQVENLSAASTEGKADPYVKVKLLFEGSVKETRKTPIAVDTVSPLFDQTFEFDFHHSALKQYTLLVCVKDAGNYGLFSKAPYLGQFSFPLKDFKSDDTLEEWFELEPK